MTSAKSLFFVISASLSILIAAALVPAVRADDLVAASYKKPKVLPIVVRGAGFTASEFGDIRRVTFGEWEFLRKDFQGGTRAQDLSLPLGPVHLVHPEKGLEGLDLVTAVQEAFLLADSIIKETGLKQSFTAIEQWNVVILPSVPRSAETGLLASARAHTAWAGPPANILIAADRFIEKAKRLNQSPEEIRESFAVLLVHEIAHAVEFQLLGRAFPKRERWHGEGFATWLENLASKADARAVGENRERVRDALIPSWSPQDFRGSSEDYLRSYALVLTLVNANGVNGLLRVYSHMAEKSVSFKQAVQDVLGWNYEMWAAKAEHFFAEDASPEDGRERFGAA